MKPFPRRAACALCLVAALAGCRAERPAAADAADAAPAPAAAPAGPAAEPEAAARPSLQVDTLDHGRYDLAEHRGRWVVVNFWATWCSPCLKEMPELSALDAMREHIEVVGLAYEEIEVGAMREFLAAHPVVYPIAIVDVYAPPADFDTPRGLPMTYLVAPDGTIAKQFLGPVTAHQIEEAIAAAGGPASGAPVQPAEATPGA
ncbi:MAG: TlpA family protein disulfide reductase [Gammaproteobacteria bacterium]